MIELGAMETDREVLDIFNRFRHPVPFSESSSHALDMEDLKENNNISERSECSQKVTCFEIAKIFKWSHSVTYHRISSFVVTAEEDQKKEFEHTTFTNSKDRKYPTWNLTKKGCELYIDKVLRYSKLYAKVSEGIHKLEEILKERFGQDLEPRQAATIFMVRDPENSEHKDLKIIFDKFITGPALEGREIIELTKRYEDFFCTMRSISPKESNQIYEAVSGIAI